MGKIVLGYLCVDAHKYTTTISGMLLRIVVGPFWTTTLLENLMRMTVLLLTTYFIVGCGSSVMNTGVMPTGDVKSSTDAASEIAQTDTSNQDLEANTSSCVDLRVNQYIYDCQDGNPETPIVADPESCMYQADMWGSKAGNTQVLDDAKRVIAKYGVHIADCLVKRKK